MKTDSNGLIVLDEYQSQIVWISKGWCDDEKISRVKALENVWSHKIGVEFESNFRIYIVDECLAILSSALGSDKILSKIVGWLSPIHSFSHELLYNDVEGYISNTLEVLMRKISLLQIKDIDNNIELIKLQELNKDIILKGVVYDKENK